jgi:MYXO-CTERM domain-containing protein
MRSCVLPGFILVGWLAGWVAGCVPQNGIDQTQQALGGYEPPAPAGSICMCPTDGGNGTCATDCNSITCDPGFANCDNRIENGCETKLDDPSACGSCGNNCHECLEEATCASGVCGGKARPDDSACRAFGCAVVGACRSGVCMCPGDGVDLGRPGLPMVQPPTKMPSGNDLPGDCSLTGGGTATASVMLLLGAALLLFRRRRSW